MNVDACMKVMRMPVAARRYGVGSSASAVPAIPAGRRGDMAARDGAEQAVARQIARHIVARHARAPRRPPPADSGTGRRPPAARGSGRRCRGRPGMEQRAGDLDRVIWRGQGARETASVDVPRIPGYRPQRVGQRPRIAADQRGQRRHVVGATQRPPRALPGNRESRAPAPAPGRRTRSRPRHPAAPARARPLPNSPGSRRESAGPAD